MKLGVMIEGQEGLTWERWRHLAATAEQLGFESLWRSDHFFSLGGVTERDSLETWVSLVDLAQHSQRLLFGPLVSPMTFRHPALLARMSAAVDNLAPGRLVVGVGAGWNVPEHSAFGIPFPPLKERMDRLEEGIRVLKALWSGDRVSLEGRYYPLTGAQMRPAPANPPPLLIGGGGEKRTLRLVARYAEEWNSVSLSPEGYRAKSAILETHCEAVGRSPSAIARSMMCAFVVGRDEAELEQRLAQLRGSMPQLASVPAGSLREALRTRGWLIGQPEQVVQQLKALEAAGLQRVMLQHHLQTDDAALELIAREVAPAVA